MFHFVIDSVYSDFGAL